MNKQIFGSAITKLEYAFRGFNVTSDKAAIMMWYEVFKNEDGQAFNQAITNYIMTEKFAPTISGIKDELLKVLSTEISNGEKEFQQIIQLVQSKGSYATSEDFNVLTPESKKALKSIGGYRGICTMQEKDIQHAKREFMKVFKDKNSEEERVLKLSSSMTESVKLFNVDERKMING